MSCAPRCRTCAPAKLACAASSTPSTPRPPTATPTSNWPPTWKASSPSSAARPPPPAPKNAGGSCACWSKTSSSARRRSPSATASRSGNQQPATAATTIQPTRRVTCAKVINCVGGVVSPLIANLFLHWAFDDWLSREYPQVRFERFADDAVIHCASEDQARQVLAEVTARLAGVGGVIHSSYYRMFSDGNTGDRAREILSTFPQPKLNIS